MSVNKRIAIIHYLFCVFILASSGFTESARAKGCGLGCQRSMGSCTVNPMLWNAALAARNSGVPLTSCCRSPEYNAQLRSCGYRPAVNSLHMSGNAIDLLIRPANCNSGYLSRFGFLRVCPLYHAGHCHISSCGTATSYRQARSAETQKLRQRRAINQRNAYTTSYRPNPQNKAPQFPNFFEFLFGGTNR